MGIRWIRRLFHPGWERTVIFTGVSQFFSIMGFAFALPFAPYYMQNLGVTDPARLKLMVALFGAATPLSLAVFSPIWGYLADRYGRRMMLLRANFAGVIVLCLMGSVRSVEALIVLRLFQGMFTGTITAAQTMVSVHTPSHRNGQAMGLLTAAIFSGSLIGAFAGGLFADWLGYRAAFLAGGGLLLIGALLVLVGTEEHVPLMAGAGQAPSWRRGAFEGAGAILLLVGALSVARQFDVSFLPLLVQDIHGGLAGAATRTGILNGVGGIAGLLAGPLLGGWADRAPPSKVARICALGAALFMIPQALVGSFAALLPLRFAMVFFTGGVDPIMQIWLAKVTPAHRRGFIFGWAGAARSIGWFMAPLGSGWIAAHFGLRAIFVAGGLVFLALIPVIGMFRARPDDGEPAGS